MKAIEVVRGIQDLRQEFSKWSKAPNRTSLLEMLGYLEKKIGMCPACNGCGSIYENKIYGNSYVTRQTNDGFIIYQYTCIDCSGSGQLVEAKCSSCSSSYQPQAFPREYVRENLCDICYSKEVEKHGLKPLPVAPEMKSKKVSRI